MKDAELKVQLSFQKQLWESLYFAYTQRFYWQLWDKQNSRLFRDANYNPQFFWDFGPMGDWRVLRLGLWEHESNGQKAYFTAQGEEINLSRSWNRSYIEVERALGARFVVGAKLWQVMDREKNDFGSFGQDNPDIQQYLGHGELKAQAQGESWRALLKYRQGWNARYQTTQLDLRLPLAFFFGLRAPGVELYLQRFSGYGESLLDYNRKIEKFSLGFAFP